MTVKPRLFSSIKIGSTELNHRVVMAPVTRFRSPNHVPSNLVAEYYEQRASTEGTLLITEATLISPEAGGYDGVPGIWSEEQVAGWKNVIDRVHAKGSKFFIQLWALGRMADPAVLEREGRDYVSSSDVAMSNTVAPRPLTIEEIKDYIEFYVRAAKNAVAAGADGVEIHASNGYLPDQFMHANTNRRTDEYGGSIENRARFTLEIVDAVSNAIGSDKVAIRFSPWNLFGEMEFEISPVPQFSYVIAEIEQRRRAGRGLAYIHTVEPRITGDKDAEHVDETQSNQFITDIWQGPIIRAGGLAPVAKEIAEENDRTLVALGRYFIANPDLPFRLSRGVNLNRYDRASFYTDVPTKSEGYTTYPFAENFEPKI
jgi:NADPH2 dehydrogenase